MKETVTCKVCKKPDKKNKMICIIDKQKNKKYYHKECFDEMECRRKTVQLYYIYTSNSDPKSWVNYSFSKIINNGYSYADILYAMRYIVNKKFTIKKVNHIEYYMLEAMKYRRQEELQKELELKQINNNKQIVQLNNYKANTDTRVE
jgi:hypothetical protein